MAVETIDTQYRIFLALLNQADGVLNRRRNDRQFSHEIQKKLKECITALANQFENQGAWSAVSGSIGGTLSIGSGLIGVTGHSVFGLTNKVTEAYSKTLGGLSHAVDGAGNTISTYYRGYETTGQGNIDLVREEANQLNRSIEEDTQLAATILRQLEQFAESVKACRTPR